MPQLHFPSQTYRTSYEEVLREFAEAGEGREGFYYNAPEELDAYITYAEERQKGNIPKKVPQTIFWFCEGKEIIGRINIRHRLNKSLRNVGGHIAYAIRPSARGKGYGTELLRQGLEYAKELGLSKVLLTCSDTNIGSQKVIETNGGVFKNIYVQPDGTRKHRYWITL